MIMRSLCGSPRIPNHHHFHAYRSAFVQLETPLTTNSAKQTLISYRSSECHNGERLWGAVLGFSESTLRRLDLEGKLTRLRRRVLGLPDEGTG